MAIKNKLFSIVGTCAIFACASLFASTPANAVVPTSPAQGVSIRNNVIANGDEMYVTFNANASAWLNAYGRFRSYCLYIDDTRQTTSTGASFSTAFNSIYSDLSGDYIESAAAGTINPVLNRNKSSIDKVYKWVGIDWAVPGQDCASLGSSLASLDSDTNVDSWAFAKTWTVTPALDTPIEQSLSVGSANSTAATVVGHGVDSAIDLSGGSHWTQDDLQNCDPTQTSAPQTVDLASLGLTLDESVSSATTMAPLKVTGTPIAGSQGVYHLCMKLRGDSGSAYAMYTLTIREGAPVTLSNTGTNSDLLWSNLSTGFLLIGIGTSFILRRRRVWK